MKTFRKHLAEKMKKPSFKKLMTNTAKPKIDPSRLRKVEIEPRETENTPIKRHTNLNKNFDKYIKKRLDVGKFKKGKK